MGSIVLPSSSLYSLTLRRVHVVRFNLQLEGSWSGNRLITVSGRVEADKSRKI